MTAAHAARHAGALAALILLAAGAPAIDPPAGAVRTRMLIGTSSEGTEVDAVMQHGQVRRIVAEALNETGRTMSDFHFDHGSLLRARIIRVGYKGYPYANMPAVPPHKHLMIDPTDTVLDDQTYDFNTAPCDALHQGCRVCKAPAGGAAGCRHLRPADEHTITRHAGGRGRLAMRAGRQRRCTGFRHETP